jgi:hypothetical protein
MSGFKTRLVTAHHSAATELGSNDVDGWKIKYLEAGTDTTTKTGDAGGALVPAFLKSATGATPVLRSRSGIRVH